MGANATYIQTQHEITGTIPITDKATQSGTEYTAGTYTLEDNASFKISRLPERDTYRQIEKSRDSTDDVYFYIPLGETYTYDYTKYYSWDHTTLKGTWSENYTIHPQYFYSAWYIDYTEDVYSIPGDTSSLPDYKYSIPEALNYTSQDDSGGYELIFGYPFNDDTYSTSYYDKDQTLIFESKKHVFVGLGSATKAWPYFDVYVTYENYLLAHETPQVYSVCDNSVYLFDIYVTKSMETAIYYSLYQTNVIALTAPIYTAFVVGYKQEGITDFSKFSLGDCTKFNTGAMINRIKELAINWQNNVSSDDKSRTFATVDKLAGALDVTQCDIMMLR